MLPFVLLLGAPLIRAVALAFPGIVSEEMRSAIVKGEALKKSFSLGMIIPGLLMLLIGSAIFFADPNWIMELKIAPSEIILVGMEMMFIVGGAILLFLGLFVTATRRFTTRIK